VDVVASILVGFYGALPFLLDETPPPVFESDETPRLAAGKRMDARFPIPSAVLAPFSVLYSCPSWNFLCALPSVPFLDCAAADLPSWQSNQRFLYPSELFLGILCLGSGCCCCWRCVPPLQEEKRSERGKVGALPWYIF